MKLSLKKKFKFMKLIKKSMKTIKKKKKKILFSIKIYQIKSITL